MANCTRHDSFADLQATWRDLLSQGAPATIFSTWEFQDTWWKVFGCGWEPHLLALSDERGVFGIAPLMRREDDFLLVGGVEVCDFLDFLALPGRQEEVIDTTLAYLGDYRGGRLDLHVLSDGSETPAIVTRLAAQRGLPLEREVEDVSPRLELPADWESYLVSLGKKDRHELRRKMRRLQSSGDVRWYAVSGESPGDVADFIHLHRLSREDKASFMHERMQQFFHTLAERFAPTGLLKLYFLEVDGQRVAATICFVQNQELWLYNSGYDPAYSPLAVGLLLKAYCLQDAIALGLRGFDFLRGREPYKYDLGATDIPVHRLTIRLKPDS